MLGRPNNLKRLTNDRLTDGDRYILHMKLCLEGYYSYKQSNAECLRTSYLIFLPYFNANMFKWDIKFALENIDEDETHSSVTCLKRDFRPVFFLIVLVFLISNEILVK